MPPVVLMTLHFAALHPPLLGPADQAVKVTLKHDLVLRVVDGAVNEAVIHKESYPSSRWICGRQIVDEKKKQQGPEDGPLRNSTNNGCHIWKCSIPHHLLGSATQEGLDRSRTAAVNAVVGELVKQSLMGDDIKAWGCLHCELVVVVYSGISGRPSSDRGWGQCHLW